MNLKPKHKFVGAASFLLSRDGSREDVLALSKEFDITEKEVEDYLKLKTKAKALSGALVGGREERDALYNMLDQKFIEKHENIVVFQRGENINFYEYKNGVYTLLLDIDMYNLVDTLMVEYALFDYRTSKRKVEDTIKRISANLSRTKDKYFSDDMLRYRKWYLNLKNGLLDMESYELKEHTASYFSTVQAPFDFNPEEQCPLFDDFIKTVSKGETSTAQMIQEMFGYCISEGNPKHKVFYLYGDTARNGKSTTAKILCGLIGWGNVSTLSLSQIAGESSSVLTSIVGKQINFADEISSKFIESSRLTAMSAEGVIEINPKFKPSYLYPVKAKFIICCNDLPRFKDSQGMKHRMIPIPFSLQIPEEKRVDRYDEILLEKEGSGILNWAIEGAKLLKENKVFLLNEESREDAHDNLLQSNSVYAFLEENYDFDEKYDKEVDTKEMYGDFADKDTRATGFRAFCIANGIGTASLPIFCKEVRRFSRETQKIAQKRIGTEKRRVYIGLKNKSNLDDF
jgi:P4 family phage/plasmid primase-like protien